MTRPEHVRTILNIQSSARQGGSTTRLLSDEFIEKLTSVIPDVKVTDRDLYHGMPFVDEQWVTANFTPEEERSAQHTATLGFSNSLIDEVEKADLLILGAPIYNFGVPAILKAWIDQIARARRTFAYGPNGPVGLLKNKQAIIFAASGGVEAGSDADFATGYLKHILGFVGIKDVTLIAANRQMIDGDNALAKARAAIEASIKNLADAMRVAPQI